MHCRHCGCWVVSRTDASSWSDWRKGIPLHHKGCGYHFWSYMEIKCSNCLLQGWSYVRLSFSNPESCVKGLGVWSLLQVDAYSPDHSEPSRAKVWTLASWIPCWCHSLRSPQPESISLSQHTPKKIPWLCLRKIEMLLFSPSGEGVSAHKFPCFFQLHHLSC